MEMNVDHGETDTIMEENEAYGVAIDGVVINRLERNEAYGAVTFQDESTGDVMVDYNKNDSMQ